VKLEDIGVGATIKGVVLQGAVKVVSINKIGEDAIQVFYQSQDGVIGEQTLFRNDEYRLAVLEEGRPWSFVGKEELVTEEGKRFKLAAEAQRIQLAHLFDPLMAIHTSDSDPLPHQITAVYESMLPKQPLRYVLADDPGAGKTIMAGLLIRELMIRGDLKRCLIVTPGSLCEQWQEEMIQKFGVIFEIFSRDMVESSHAGNPFEEKDLLIARIDQLARAEDLQEKLENTDWDLIVVDEAHKMSASWNGTKLKKTKRYALGEILGQKTRHFLLMTATPHNGKEEDFQQFMALIDSDRFYGKYRDGVHQVDTSDLMRRMVKEELLKFDGTRLFPERRAYTVNYQLSGLEAALYERVTDYVRNEMNRADKVAGKRKSTVGFALTILQRRLASSPEAIYQSLKRRTKKLERMLEEVKLQKRGLSEISKYDGMSPEDYDDFYEDMPDEELEEAEDEILDEATAAQTAEELAAEIVILGGLVEQAKKVVGADADTKWLELSSLLQKNKQMFDSSGSRRKILIFTEHKDTLNYLTDKISSMLGNPNAVVTIHGGVKREERRKRQGLFTHDKDVVVMVATDAAGEGINLQRASLMVNYDLPWNPNRMEQRFGRIHRIGQMEVCHLWNLLAGETREGDVFQRLFAKLEVVRATLGGKVFDVLGQVFEENSLKDLLMDAIRYGEQPEVKARLHEVVEGVLDHDHLKEIMDRNALATDHMDISRVYKIKEDMEKAEALKLQPYFIKSFFDEAFKRQGGDLKKREPGRFEINHVPAAIRSRDRVIGTGQPVLSKYQRVCYEKDKIRIEGKPEIASLIAPGHPIMDSIIDLTLEQERDLLKQGCILVDKADEGNEPHLMFIVNHAIRDAGKAKDGTQRIISQRMQFIMINEGGEVTIGGHAPYLDFEEVASDEFSQIKSILEESWLKQDLEQPVIAHAVQNLVPEHINDVKQRREEKVDKTLNAVHERLTKEINHWTHRYQQLKVQADAGKQPRMQPENARRRAEELTSRLKERKEDLEIQRHVTSSTPLVIGGALIIPQGLLNKRSGKEVPMWAVDAKARKRVEMAAMNAVMDAERSLGFEPTDVSAQKLGWDVQSRMGDGDVRFIEVKGRVKGAPTVTVTKNEILASFNQPDRFILAIVLVDGDSVDGPYYLRKPFKSEPDFGVTSINLDLATMLSQAQLPN